MGKRVIAFFIDEAVLSLVAVFPLLRFVPESYVSDPSSAAYAWVTCLVLLLSVSYWTLTEWLAGGQSVGKMVMRIRTVSRSSSSGLSFSQALLRSIPKSTNVLLMIDCLPLLRFGGEGFRISDSVFGTKVVDWSAGGEDDY